jgi:hypothetical protein
VDGRDGVERVLEVIFVSKEIVCGPQVKWEIQGAHQFQAAGDMRRCALIEKMELPAALPAR